MQQLKMVKTFVPWNIAFKSWEAFREKVNQKMSETAEEEEDPKAF